MRVLLQCDPTPDHGVGRVLRGFSLAEALRARGHDPVLCADISEPWANELVQEAGIAVLPPAADADDLRDLATGQSAALVHLDTADPMGRAPRLAGVGCAISVLYDGMPNGKHDGTDDAGADAGPVDLQVRPGLAPTGRADDGDPGTPSTDGRIRAAGARYAPVRSAVLDARQRREWRAGGMGDRLRVLVRLGAEDSAELLLPVVQGLANSDVAADVLTVAPSHSTGMRAESMSTRTVRVLATSRRADLPRLVADHDLVVTRPGPVLWEISCIGAPMALVPLTPDEDTLAAAWVAAGVAVAFGRPGPGSPIANQLRALLRDGMRRADLSTAGRRLVDGQGAARVAELMEAVVHR